MTIKKLKSIDIINVLSDLVSEKLETTVKLPFVAELTKALVKITKIPASNQYVTISEFEKWGHGGVYE